MREMKETGVEWLGKIPTNWKLTKIKYVSSIVSGEYIDKNSYDEEGVYPIIGSNGLIGHSNKFNNCSKVITTGRVGSVGTAHLVDVAWITDNTLILKSNGSVLRKFLYYVLPNFDYQYISSGTAQPLITASKLSQQIFAVPSMQQQDLIIHYLDTKCTEIDALSADIQSEIDTLQEYKKSVITEAVTKGLDKNAPMTDSGLQWVGEMPSHWELVRGKYCLKYLQKPVRQDDGVITCFRDGEVTLRSKRREEGFTMSDKEIGYQGIDEGDLVVHGMDGFAGAIGISDSRGKASPVLNVLDTEENKKYFMYYLRSMAYGDVFLALATGIRVRSCDLRWNKLAELSYPIPPKDEQDAIVAYIDNQLQRADEIIKDKQEQLEVLADYKKSVIYEYVTGKKEI